LQNGRSSWIEPPFAGTGSGACSARAESVAADCDDGPACLRDLDRLPAVIAKIDVDIVVVARDPNVHIAAFALENCLGIEGFDCDFQRIGVAAALFRLVILMPQPTPKCRPADAVRFTVVADEHVHESLALGGMKECRSRGKLK
jgi:hypothetical protein